MQGIQQRYSHRRDQIFQWVCDHNVHPTAAMVYSGLSSDNPQLSLATVYRNLNQLSQEGRLRKIPMPDGSDRFDGNLSPHVHVCCRCCGRIVDVTLPRDQRLEELLEGSTGYRVDPMELVFSGVCPSCQNQIQHQEEEQNGTQGL